jgi:hypothetical protein
MRVAGACVRILALSDVTCAGAGLLLGMMRLAYAWAGVAGRCLRACDMRGFGDAGLVESGEFRGFLA